MPKRKNETNQQWMDRLRAERGLPPLEREELFSRVRAAKCYLGTSRANHPGTEFQAFMHIFHPDHRLTGTDEGMRLAREMNKDSK